MLEDDELVDEDVLDDVLELVEELVDDEVELDVDEDVDDDVELEVVATSSYGISVEKAADAGLDKVLEFPEASVRALFRCQDAFNPDAESMEVALLAFISVADLVVSHILTSSIKPSI